MNSKLAKRMRKFVKETMAEKAKWCVYDTKVFTKPIFSGKLGSDGKPEIIDSVTNVKTLVKGCGRQRYKSLKKMYGQLQKKGVQV